MCEVPPRVRVVVTNLKSSTVRLNALSASANDLELASEHPSHVLPAGAEPGGCGTPGAFCAGRPGQRDQDPVPECRLPRPIASESESLELRPSRMLRHRLEVAFWAQYAALGPCRGDSDGPPALRPQLLLGLAADVVA
jgi:hypothetical protein